VMIDRCKWPFSDELVIGLVLCLSVCSVSGPVSANEQKETNSRYGGSGLLS
jgi:hypothetical protein